MSRIDEMLKKFDEQMELLEKSKLPPKTWFEVHRDYINKELTTIINALNNEKYERKEDFIKALKKIVTACQLPPPKGGGL